MSRLLEVLFGCSHHRLTFPMSRRMVTPPQITGTYVVCLDCGREFPYDWREMRILAENEQIPVLTEARQTAERAA